MVADVTEVETHYATPTSFQPHPPPMTLPDGIHVLYMIRNKPPTLFDFAVARDQVLTDYRNDAIGHLRTGDEAFLRKRANVLIAES